MQVQRFCTEDGIQKLHSGKAANIFVISINRYIVDPSYLSVVGHVAQNVYSAYDIFVTDGKWVTKLALSPSLNHLVERGRLLPNQVLAIEKVEFKYNESHIDGAIPCLLVVAATPKQRVIDATYPSLPWYDIKFLGEDVSDDKIQKIHQRLETCPTLGSRGCYLHLLCDDCPQGVQWSPKPEVRREYQQFQDLFQSETEQIYPLDVIASDFDVKTGRLRRAKTPKKSKDLLVVGWVVAKSRISCWAKTTEDKKWPFAFTAIIELYGHRCEVSFWEQATLNFVRSINVGDLIIIRGPRVSASYEGVFDEKSSEPAETAIDIAAFTDPMKPNSVFELKVSPKAGRSIHMVNVITGPESEFGIFERPETFVNVTKDLTTVRPGELASFCGIVTFVSAVFRKEIRPGVYCACKWIRVRHKLTSSEHSALINPNSDWKTFESVQVGDVVLLTNMRPRHTIFTHDASGPVYAIQLIATRRSQIYIVKDNLPTIFNSPEVQESIEAAESDNHKFAQFLQYQPQTEKSSTGGFINEICYYNMWYQRVATIDEWKNLHIQTDPTPAGLLPDICASLLFREEKEILVMLRLKNIRLNLGKKLDLTKEFSPFDNRYKRRASTEPAIYTLVFTTVNPIQNEYKELWLALPISPLLTNPTKHLDEESARIRTNTERRCIALRDFFRLTDTITDAHIRKQLERRGGEQRVAQKIVATLKSEMLAVSISLFAASFGDIEMVATNVFRLGLYIS